MKIGFLSLPLSGHLNPMTSLARALQSRGNDVVFLGVPDVEPFARAAGLDFVPFCEQEYPAGSIARIWSQVATLRGLEVVEFTLRELSPGLLKAALEHLPKTLAEAGIEVLVIDKVFFFVELAAMHFGMPYVHVWNVLNLDFSGHSPAFFFSWPYESTPEARARYAELAQTVGGTLAPIVEVAQPYAQELGLEVDWSNPTATLSPLAVLSQIPREFDFPGIPWPAQFHYTGPFHDGKGREPVPFPWEELNGKPLIYASLGTLVNGLEDVYRTILEVAGRLPDAQFVLSVGNNVDIDRIGPIPSNAIVVRKAPQIELLKRAALCITHAGLNTALEALAQGVPMVAIPIGYDQPGVAARIAYHGAGEFIDVEDLTTERLSKLIQQVRTGRAYRFKARHFQKVIAQARGLDVAAEVIEQAFGIPQAANSTGEEAELSHV
ncbi:MAG TPA: glycosyltransferase [Silvibacterium sp.]|nr:glycosyltransferase [Silvibacterium sp.]